MSLNKHGKRDNSHLRSMIFPFKTSFMGAIGLAFKDDLHIFFGLPSLHLLWSVPVSSLFAYPRGYCVYPQGAVGEPAGHVDTSYKWVSTPWTSPIYLAQTL